MPGNLFGKDGKAIMKMINDILKTNGHTLWSVAPESSVNNAIKLMADKQVQALPVLKAGKLVGIISELDCIEKVILKGKSPEETPISRIMTRHIISTSPAQTVEDCLDVMTEEHIQHLPVVAGTGLLGFVSMSDLLRTIISDQKDYIYRLENYVLGIGFT
jgi:CBS domain-containing protein